MGYENNKSEVDQKVDTLVELARRGELSDLDYIKKMIKSIDISYTVVKRDDIIKNIFDNGE